MSSVTVRRRSEGAFFAAIAVAMFAAVYIGFEDSYFRAGLFFAHLPSLVVHVHGALFVSWVLLLIAQVGLVASGHTRWHRRLGILGAVIAPSMVIFGGWTLVLALRRNAVPRIPPAVFFAGDLLQLVVFACFVIAALCMRNRAPDTHKRFMLFATIAILAPAIDRWDFHRDPPTASGNPHGLDRLRGDDRWHIRHSRNTFVAAIHVLGRSLTVVSLARMRGRRPRPDTCP